MSFVEALRRARQLLREERRLSVRALARELDLEGDDLEGVIEELVDVQQVISWEGQVLVGSGGEPEERESAPAEARPEVASEPPEGPAPSVVAAGMDARRITSPSSCA